MLRIAGTTAPFGAVFKRELEMLVMARLVVVPFDPVKFWRVEEARVRTPPVSVVRPFTASVPVRLACVPMFCPFTSPAVRVVAKRFVEEAEVAKSEVVVALVEVELRAVKFWRVVEPVVRRVASVVAPETLSDVRVPIEVRDESVVTEELI